MATNNYLAVTLVRIAKELAASLKRKPQQVVEYSHASLATYDDEQKISAYQTQLEIMAPDKQHLYELLQEFRETKNKWEQKLGELSQLLTKRRKNQNSHDASK